MRECLQPHEIGCRAELREHAAGGVQPMPAASSSPMDRQPSPTSTRTRAGLIQRLQLLPGLPGAAQRDHGGAGVALRSSIAPRAWFATARSAGVS